MVEHCKYLIKVKQLQGFDANAIYEQTKELPFGEDYRGGHSEGDESDSDSSTLPI